MVDYATVDDIVFRLGLVTLGMYIYAISGTFSVGETITGGTSGATAIVRSYDSINAKLEIIWQSGKFVKDETITGGTSGATAKVTYSESTLIQDLIDAAEDLVDEYTQTKFGDSNIGQTDYIDPYDDQEDIWLCKAPVTAISSIEFKGTSLGTLNTDYWLYGDIGMVKVKAGKIYADDPQSLKVVYTWGNPTVPSAVKQAVIEMVVNVWEHYKQYRNLGGSVSMSMADFSVKFQKQVMLIPEIEQMLAKHRRRRMVTAV